MPRHTLSFPVRRSERWTTSEPSIPEGCGGQAALLVFSNLTAQAWNNSSPQLGETGLRKCHHIQRGPVKNTFFSEPAPVPEPVNTTDVGVYDGKSAYDGASNMSGEYNGCQAIIKSENALAVFFHCGAHSSNLVAGDVSNCCPELRDALMAVGELGVLAARSGKFKQLFCERKSEKNIKPLCPTRFLCRKPAISAALDEHDAIIAALDEMMKEAPAEQSAKISGILHSMESGDTRLLLKIALRVFSVLEDLNTYLQGRSSTVHGMLQVVETSKRELRHLRSVEMFSELFDGTAKAAEYGKVHPVEPPRSRRRPARFRENRDVQGPGTCSCEPLSEADLDVIRRYKSIDIGKVVSRLRLLHEEHCNLKSVQQYSGTCTRPPASISRKWRMFSGLS
ncbi:hypothetical protein HPB48_023063 [Haemaphysalis longicornis]|uniref:Uncharacterized protein n=1 Tax=Haemaphysalis longicornis TaxID=44386 RepID=A0A9J6H3U7_HAELO|nr:hypothetical protein HPB48_023063 [Haemaphysalis longicornis]